MRKPPIRVWEKLPETHFPGKQAERIMAERELVTRNRELMNIQNLSMTLPNPVRPSGNTLRLLDLCFSLELKSLTDSPEWSRFKDDSFHELYGTSE